MDRPFGDLQIGGLGLALFVAIGTAGCAGAPVQPAPAEPLPDLHTLWDWEHPEQSEAEFRRRLVEARRAGDADAVARLLTQVARALSLQMKFEEAHRVLDEADALLTPELEVARVLSLLERGRTFNSAGAPERAEPLFLQAWTRARESGLDALSVDAAHMVAIVEAPDQAIRWNQRAIAIARRSGDPAARRWLGSLSNNLGWALHDRGDYDAALEAFRETQLWEERAGNPEMVRIARWSVARAFRSLGRVAEALAIQRALRAETLASGGVTDGFVDEELAECLWALGRADEARPHFAAAYAALSSDPWMRAHDAERLERLRGLAGGP